MAKECSNSSCSKESCEGCPSKAGQGKPDFHIDLNADSSIKHVIGVVSGKGGVGKSMVTASLANQKAKEGYKVGILDADITGPSIPKMYGLKGPANVDDKGVYPAVAANGVKVMSINLLLPGEEEPVIWRGPVIAGTVKQFWTDVIWGDLDYLFVDMPPGTGDVPLTVFQSLPVDGVVIVSSPQDLVRMIVMKAYKMAQMMSVPVLGLNTDDFPAFYCRKSGFGVDYNAKTPADVAAIAKAKWGMGLQGGMLIGNPVPEEYAMDFDQMSAVIDKAMAMADENGVKGKNITPFLLAHIVELTGGDSLKTNIQLAYNNARAAAQIAVELAK